MIRLRHAEYFVVKSIHLNCKISTQALVQSDRIHNVSRKTPSVRLPVDFPEPCSYDIKDPYQEMQTNGSHAAAQTLASELRSLLEIALQQVIPFAEAADEEVAAHRSNHPVQRTSLVDPHTPKKLSSLLSQFLSISSQPRGQDGFRNDVETILRYSVNTMSPGFMDKLYSAPVPPGVAADLILSVLNTNVHVYHVSPILTLIEKSVTKALASLFGFGGPRAGGINVQGGSSSNASSIVIARNTLYPKTKMYGNSTDDMKLVLLTSAHGHYSIEKAAVSCGLGSESVVAVPVDPVRGAMIPSELERLVIEAKAEGKTPFFVNATAGTTVLGSFDPFAEVAAIARKHRMWLHIDGAWGGSFAFSEKLRFQKLKGCELADSIAINPHKMMGVPVTCSFLLAKDLKQFHDANTLRAGYLFHADEEMLELGDLERENVDEEPNGHVLNETKENWQEPEDLADLTLQCGRRGDGLKLFMAWQFYGTEGYREKIENAYEIACHMANLVVKQKDFLLVSENPPPCLQVCFYYAPHRSVLFGEGADQIQPPVLASAGNKDHFLEKHNSKVTERVTQALISRGFMVDFAPALEGYTRRGKFFRVVISISSSKETVERLVQDIQVLGDKVVHELRSRYTSSKQGNQPGLSS